LPRQRVDGVGLDLCVRRPWWRDVAPLGNARASPAAEAGRILRRAEHAERDVRQIVLRTGVADRPSGADPAGEITAVAEASREADVDTVEHFRCLAEVIHAGDQVVHLAELARDDVEQAADLLAAVRPQPRV